MVGIQEYNARKMTPLTKEMGAMRIRVIIFHAVLFFTSADAWRKNDPEGKLKDTKVRKSPIGMYISWLI